MVCGWTSAGHGEQFGILGDRLNHFSKVVVHDLCEALCTTARKRVFSRGWSNFADVICGDAQIRVSGFKAGTVDVVTFSYALSMIPDWRKQFKMLQAAQARWIHCSVRLHCLQRAVAGDGDFLDVGLRP